MRDLGPRRLKDLIHPEQIFQAVTPGLPSEFAPLKTLDVHPHNLPIQLTSFIGREHEMAEVKKLLQTTHILTLTGTGGTGKSRLALQVAADLIDVYPDGIWLVELAPVPTPDLVEQTVTTVLGVHLQPGSLLSDLLVNYMRKKQLLLILDNCEHLVEACAQLANLLLCSSPRVKILATSRVHLNITGEKTYQVPPLTFPLPEKARPSQVLLEYEAVRLFIERACALKPDFKVTNENASAVAQICTHLDGLPLAIELAAARVRHLSPEQICVHLGDRFSLLTGGSRTALPRHQTLRAAIDWSYDLLSEAERALFTRLAVFPSSFSLEAAEFICSDDVIGKSNVINLLGSLVDHSLVNSLERSGEYRYVLPETTRQYTFEKLTTSGELPIMQNKHLEYFVEFADRGVSVVSVGNPRWMMLFENEYDNIRYAMEYAIKNDIDAAASLEPVLAWFCDFSYRNKEFYDWSMRILELTESLPPGKTRAIALCEAGNGKIMIDDLEQAQIYLNASWEIVQELDDNELKAIVMHDIAVLSSMKADWQQTIKLSDAYLVFASAQNDKAGMVAALGPLGIAKVRIGEKAQGISYIYQALKLAKQENFPYYIAGGLRLLAEEALLDGEFVKAIEMLTESVHNYKLFGYPTALAWSLYRLGQAELIMGNAIQSKELFDECLAVSREYKYLDGQRLYPLGVAGVAALLEHDECAARLFGMALSIIESTNSSIPDVSHKVFDPLIASVHDRLGDSEYTRLWEEGRKLTLEQAIELAMNCAPLPEICMPTDPI